MNRWYGAFVTIFVLGSGWLWLNQVPLAARQSDRVPQPAIGHPAPEFALTMLDGQDFSLAAQQGTPVVLNFWATWCGPCRRELPALQAAAERYDGYVQIIGVDQAEAATIVQQYVDELGLTFDIPLDEDGAVGQRYGVMGLPTTFFIDKNGVIRHIWSGEMNSITLAEGIAQILP